MPATGTRRSVAGYPYQVGRVKAGLVGVAYVRVPHPERPVWRRQEVPEYANDLHSVWLAKVVQVVHSDDLAAQVSGQLPSAWPRVRLAARPKPRP